MSRFPTAGLRAPRVAFLSGLGASWDNPLKPEELPAGLLYIHPRYTLKVLDDLISGDATLQQCEDWARDPPDWVKKKKNKLGQDSYRLACFIRHRLNHRIPTGATDYGTMDSDAALVIEGRWKFNDLEMHTLAEWATKAPNWKPWNRKGDLTAVVMPAILWARKVASARAGIDIPFFVDSTVEDLTDQLVAAQEAVLLTILEVICNIIATLGAGAVGSGATAAKEGGKEVAKEGVKQGFKEGAKETAIKTGKTYIVGKTKSEGGKLVRETAQSNIDSKKGQDAAIAAGAGAIAGGAAFLAATPPVGWVAIGIIALAPILCWGLKEGALQYIKSNLREVVPDFVPQFITLVYVMRFGAAPTAEQVAELDRRYSGLVSAESIAKAVASPENNPAIIDAVSQRQAIIRSAVNDAVRKLTNCNPIPGRVAGVADKAFNGLWTDQQIADYVAKNRLSLCTTTVPTKVMERSATLRTTLASQAIANLKPVKPLATANVTPSTPKATLIKKTLLPPKAKPLPQKKAGIGAALALATGGFFVGGPIGAGIGFVVGLAAGGKKA